MITKAVLIAIRFYKRMMTPLSVQLFGNGFGCRFYPSCSEYGHTAIEKYGLAKGGFKSVGRVLRCNPLFRGGIDILN